jgi:hypothetical protein
MPHHRKSLFKDLNHTYPNNGGSFQARSKLPGAIGTSGTPEAGGFDSLSAIFFFVVYTANFCSSRIFFCFSALSTGIPVTVPGPTLIKRSGTGTDKSNNQLAVLVLIFACFAPSQQALSIAAASTASL